MVALTACRGLFDLPLVAHPQRGTVDEHELPERRPRNDVERGPQNGLAPFPNGNGRQQLINISENVLFRFRHGLPGELVEVVLDWPEIGRRPHLPPWLLPVLTAVQLPTPDPPHTLHLQQPPNAFFLAVHKAGANITLLEFACSVYTAVFLQGHQEPVQTSFESVAGVALDPLLGPAKHVGLEARVLVWEDAVFQSALHLVCMNLQKGAACIVGEGHQDGYSFAAEVARPWTTSVEAPATSCLNQSALLILLLVARG